MGRPGPLQDLPLERFLLPDTNVPNTPSKYLRTTKRPLSPGTLALHSPAKRRILTEEGIFSPERASRSPASSSSRGRFASEYFDALLKGPDSPAKRLDFGTPKSSGRPSITSLPSSQIAISASVDRDDTVTTPRKSAPSTNRLVPSPELVSRRSDPSFGRMSRTSSMMDEDDTENDYFPPDARSSSSHTPASLLSPHDNASCDRQSIHYPGFDVFCDAFDASNARSELRALDADQEMGDGATERRLVADTPRDKDEDKENSRPRRKPHKAPSAPAVPADTAWIKAGLLSPQAKQKEVDRSGKAKTTPASPSVKRIYEIREGSATPKSRVLALMDVQTSLGSNSLSASPGRIPVSEHERRLRRKAMEEEDHAIDDDDDNPL